MKRYLLTSAALLGLFGTPGFAADLPVKAKPVICAACDWNGFYLGVNVGGVLGQGRSDDSIALFPPGIPGGQPGTTAPGVVNPISSVSATNAPAGALAGGQIGFNWQSGNLVLGAEADWNWSNARDNIQTQNFFASSVVVAPANLTATDEQKLNWLATARARLGWAHDYFLWYVTGGVAFGDVESNYTFQVTPSTTGTFATGFASASASTTKTGWTVGAGVETSLAWLGAGNHWSAKVEYLFVDLGTVSNTFAVPVTGTPGSNYIVTSSSRIQDHIVRAGLNYRFNANSAQQATSVASMAACPQCDWRGFYIGANLGGSIARNRTDDSISLFPPGSPAGVTNPISSVPATNASTGAIGGVQLGYNWQFGKWVFGAEGDWAWTNQRDHIDRSNFLASTVVVAPATLTYSDEQKVNWLATVRGRVGLAQNCFLWYVTGGAAFAEIESNYSLQVNPSTTTTFATGAAASGGTRTKTGWTIGGGVETSLPWMNANRWSAKLEYLFVDLGSVDNVVNVPVTATPTTIYSYTSSSRIQDHIVRAGINYRFGS